MYPTIQKQKAPMSGWSSLTSILLPFGILFPSVSALVADQTAPEERGMATGIFHALLTAGVAIGAPVMGWVGGALGVQLGLMLSAGTMVLALVVALGIRKRI